VKVKGLTFSADFATAKHSGSEASVALIHGSYATWHGLDFALTEPADVLVTHRPPDQWEVQIGAQSPGEVWIRVPGETARVQEIGGATVPARRQGERVVFKAEPLKRYRVGP
jgi:hypothetical protein